MTTYSVLWFDDDFEPVENTESEAENRQRKTFQADVINARKTHRFHVDGVSNYEEFCEKLHSISRYQAVVLDLRGLEKNGKASDFVMYEALQELNEAADLPVFIYSSDTEDDHFELLISPMREKGRCFNKAQGITPLFKKMRLDLDDSLHFYEGYPECLELFNEGFLDENNKSNMDLIVENHATMDVDFAPYNCMRHILENMMQEMVDHGFIPEKNRTLNQRIDYLVKRCHRKNDAPHELDFDNPVVPFSVCPREVKRVISFLADMTNHNSHYFESTFSYLRPDESVREYKELLLQTVYPAFFYVMKWYYGFMTISRKK